MLPNDIPLFFFQKARETTAKVMINTKDNPNIQQLNIAYDIIYTCCINIAQLLIELKPQYSSWEVKQRKKQIYN